MKKGRKEEVNREVGIEKSANAPIGHGMGGVEGEGRVAKYTLVTQYVSGSKEKGRAAVLSKTRCSNGGNGRCKYRRSIPEGKKETSHKAKERY